MNGNEAILDVDFLNYVLQDLIDFGIKTYEHKVNA